ncbi:hypothetical protein F511_28979 [Dorcoceras hygrometricum]|uniref:Uncharacterized protein n=1 Tax=Dorcoceras hygrometricum TaxID=472368 RepID=A0A2Z7DB49_9LAMI|nr:hypothetical protein F511_28979 [Dorcoceras hygrometricum]
MQNGQYTDTLGMDKSLVLYVGEKESADDDDDLARRLKNRERQRRYRERKRHEANLKKASIVDQAIPVCNMQMSTELESIPVQVDVLVNLNSPARVHCRRDWKKDARTACIQKKQETGALVPDNSETTILYGTPAPMSQSDFGAKESNISHSSISSKRNWKVEARNKKSLE